MFTLLSAVGVAIIVRRWHDRPTSRSLGLLALCLPYGGFGVGAALTAAAVPGGVVALWTSVCTAILCAAAAAVVHVRSWLVSRRIRRIGATHGILAPRERLGAPALILLYLAGALLAMLASVGLALVGVTWPLTNTIRLLPDMPPVPIAATLPLAFIGAGFLHYIGRPMSILIRDIWSSWPPRT